MSGHYIDLDTWPRRPAYDFFIGFEVPFFEISVEVPVEATRAWCKANGHSFTWAGWFLFQQAVNAVEPMRMRIRGDRVWVHDRISVATTLLNPDRTFRYLHLPFEPTFAAFEARARALAATPPPPVLDARGEDDAVIHGTIVPWLRFNSIKHARPKLIVDHSIPTIVFGRISKTPDGEVMPLSVSAHHAVVDGAHIGELVERFTGYLADPVSHLTT